MVDLKELLTRSIDTIYPDQQTLERKLRKGKIKIYWGIDPTGPNLHLSHMENLLILKRFQDLGHQVVLLIGDATAQIGDPSERTSKRKPLTRGQVHKNARNYKKQASKILRFSGKNAARVRLNSQWWGRIGYIEAMAKIGYHFTSQQLLERKMFQERIAVQNPPTVPEFLYPMMQAYDSVALDIDVELGGTDQIFNMLAGRDLVKQMLDKEKFVIAKKILTDPKTGEMLMSKTRGNTITLMEEPNEMFGKIMALPDEILVNCFEMWTTLPMVKIRDILKKMSPVEAKRKLAYEVTLMLHSRKKADRAQKEFESVFSRGGIPEDAPIWNLAGKKVDLPSLLVKEKIAATKSEVRRLIDQDGISLNGEKLSDAKVKLQKGILRIGKKTFIKIA